MIKKFYKKLLFRIRLRILRGNKILTIKNKQYIFAKFEENLANSISKNINKLSNKDKVYVQYLARSFFNRLKISFLYCVGRKKRLIFPLPNEWINNVQKDLIRVNKILSSILFFFYALIHIPICIKIFIKILFSNQKLSQNHIFFADLNNINFLPNKKNDFYLIHIFKRNLDCDFNHIYHKCNVDDYDYENVPITFCNNIHPLDNYQKVKFSVWFLIKILTSLAKLLLLKPKPLILFREEILDKQLEYFIESNGVLANKYIFLNHSLNFRPLWTYNKNLKNRVIMINEPSSFYGFKNKQNSKYPKDLYSLILNTWSNQLVLNKDYFEYLRSLNTSINLNLAKKPDIKYSKFFKDKINLKHSKVYVAIFDVTPLRKYSRAIILPQDNYRTIKVCIKFFEDIIRLSKELEFEIIWKQKRDKNLTRDHKYYWYIAEKYKSLTIDPNLTAQRVASISDISICAAFTSAAFYKNKNGNMNSIFYDPVNLISKDDRGSQGQKIVNGYEELKDHMMQIIN